MSEGRSTSESSKSWLGRLTQALSAEPKSREELLELIQSASDRGLIDQESLHIIESTLTVSEQQVRDIMVPRAQMTAIRDNSDPKDFLPIMLESAHSRFPVLASDNSDEVVGIIFAKDLLKLLLSEQRIDRFSWKDYLRPALFVPESTHIDKLLREFRTKKSHMAIVVNEYGGIAGLVTMEDALEQIVGDIDDEHDFDDEEDSLIRELEPGSFLISAITPIADFNEFFKGQFSDEDFDTIGGIVMNAFERLPKSDEVIVIDRWRFTVLDADSRAIRQLKVEPA